MPDWLAIALAFQDWKEWAQTESGLAKDALHVHIGLAFFIASRLLWRWRGGWVVAWLVALAVAGGGELLDMRTTGADLSAAPDPAHWHDIWNTMLWPTILAVVGHWLSPRPKAAPLPNLSEAVAPPAASPAPSDERADHPFEQA